MQISGMLMITVYAGFKEMLEDDHVYPGHFAVLSPFFVVRMNGCNCKTTKCIAGIKHLYANING